MAARLGCLGSLLPGNLQAGSTVLQGPGPALAGEPGLKWRLYPSQKPNGAAHREPWQRAEGPQRLLGAWTPNSPQNAEFPSQRSHHSGAPDPRFSPPPKMDSPAARGFERGTAHLERPAGERGPRPSGARRQRPPTSSSCSLATAQERAVG